MSQFVFGSGSVFAIPASLSATPAQFGTLQDVSVDFSFTNKELLGQYQFPVAVGRGPGKIEGKAKAASFSANFFNQAFFGVTPVAGETLSALNEAHSVPGVSTYTITITPPSSGVFLDDMGVVYSATGIVLQRVTSVAAAGQYSVNLATGIYTFFSADASAAVLISYSYTVAAAGYSAVLANQLMGASPIFKIVLSNSYNNNNLTLELYQVTSSKLSLGFKNTDWSVPEFDFQAFTNAANNLGKLSLTTL